MAGLHGYVTGKCSHNTHFTAQEYPQVHFSYYSIKKDGAAL